MTIKPVADLYLIKYEDGRLYKCTRDAEEAVDAIGFGFEVEEFVSLDNHRAAMLQGAEPVSNCDELTDAVNGLLAVMDEYPESLVPINRDSAVVRQLRAAMLHDEDVNSPDGWVACSERMPEIGIKVLCFPVNDEPIHASYNGQVWLQDISWSTSDEPIDNVISCNVFHWMPLPTAPQQEAKP